jgi:hypothetical protein
MYNRLIRLDAKQTNKTCYIRCEANKYLLIFASRTEYCGAPYFKVRQLITW